MKKVSHININCSNLYTSIQFYSNLGFQINGNILEEKATKKILLQKKSTFKGEQNPALLLIEYLISNDNGTNTKKIPGIQEGYVPGIARMAIWVLNIKDEQKRLRNLGINTFITKPITDTPPGSRTATTIVALRDPDNVMVELVELPGVRKYPFFVHVNINVTNYKRSWKFYNEILGFQINAYLGAVENSFYKTLQIPDPGFARNVALIKLDGNPSFNIDLIEWRDPQTSGIAPKNDPNTLGMIGITIECETFQIFKDQVDLMMKHSSSGKNVVQQIVLPSIGTCDSFITTDLDGTTIELIYIKHLNNKL